MNEAGANKKPNGQLLWGIVLVLVGIAVFIRISQVMPRLEEMGQFGWFSRFGLYLMGIILLGGGIKKIIAYFQSPTEDAVTTSDTNQND